MSIMFNEIYIYQGGLKISYDDIKTAVDFFD